MVLSLNLVNVSFQNNFNNHGINQISITDDNLDSSSEQKLPNS